MTDKPSIWSTEEVDSIEHALSMERFGRYLDIASTKSEALEYYRWNTALSAAFYGPLQCLEVGLRNVTHAQLAKKWGASWYQNGSVLTGRDLSATRDAVEKVKDAGKAVVPGRVVAELSFGFWVGLFANHYDTTIWRTDLYRCFSPRPARRDLHDKLDRLRTLRNRIAHHEPIFQRKLIEDYARIREVIRSFSPELCVWMEFHSRALDVLAEDPTVASGF